MLMQFNYCLYSYYLDYKNTTFCVYITQSIIKNKVVKNMCKIVFL